MSKPIVPPLHPIIKHLPPSIPANWRAQCSGLFVVIDPQLLKKIFDYFSAKDTKDLASLAVTCKYLQYLTQPELEIHKKAIKIILKEKGVKKYFTIPKQIISKVRGRPVKRSPFQLGKEPLRLFDFPLELNRLILSFVPYEDLMKALRTSKGFQAEVLDQVMLRLEKKETFTFNELQELKSLIRCAFRDKNVEQAILERVKAVDLSGCDLDDAKLKKLNLNQYVNLKTVDLSNSEKITDQGLPFLPEQITELSLFTCSNIADKGSKNLPKGLQSINIRSCPLATPKGVADLPKTVESLYVELISQEELKLFSGLKKLDATIVSLDKDVEFPSTLEELTVSNTAMSPEIMAKLPPDLKKLELRDCSEMEGELSFPKGLTHLTLYYNWCEDGTSLKLPENLEELSIHGFAVTEAILSELPNSLKRLHISDLKLKSITAEGWKNLRSLKQLTRLGIPYVENLALKDIFSQVEEPTLVVKDEGDDPKDLSPNLLLFPELEELAVGLVVDAEGDDLKHLPPSLKKLSLYYKGKGLKSLPHGIESLRLAQWSTVTNEYFSALPKNLRSLEFYYSPGMSIENLPSGLTDLSIVGSTRGGKWGSVSVLNIFRAKGKRKTKFISSSKLQTNWLENLPSGIKRLKLSFFFGITLNDLKHLPKNIRELDLEGCDISNEEMNNFLKHLPKELTKLKRINHHQILKKEKKLI